MMSHITLTELFQLNTNSISIIKYTSYMSFHLHWCILVHSTKECKWYIHIKKICMNEIKSSSDVFPYPLRIIGITLEFKINKYGSFDVATHKLKKLISHRQ